jgi:hypothetical protein
MNIHVKLSTCALDIFMANIHLARSQFQAYMPNGQDTGYQYGPRFRDDQRVLARITSAIKDEKEFTDSPMDWCLDALRNCASADNWYNYEKAWD